MVRGMAVATNLPRELSSIVGRDAAIEEVALLVEEAPLVTLFGVGGAGKTRLALRVGHVLAERGGRLVQDGVWMVELAPTASSEQVWRAVAAALGVAVQRPHSLEAVLVDFVRTRNLVLVLDNCEHVVAIAAELTERLLTASPGLRVLATSREPLGSYGEITWPVPPSRCRSATIRNPWLTAPPVICSWTARARRGATSK